MRILAKTAALLGILGLFDAGLAVASAIETGAETASQLEQPGSRINGLASWYGGGEPLNRRTASGTRVDADALEAAMWEMPFGTAVKVTNRNNGRSVVVRITDRGPSHRFSKRVIDLSRRAFRALAPLRQGLIPVTVERIRAPRSSGDTLP